MELFHEVAEEKEVEEIAGKLFEAKRTKSGESYGLLAAFVSEDSFPILISSLKKVKTGCSVYLFSVKKQSL